jgi:hypothetical protein
MPPTCPSTCRAPLRRTIAGGAIGREALECRHSGEAAPGSSPARRYTATPEALDAVPCRAPRHAGPLRQDDAGGALGREALDAGAVASGAGIKAGEALHREALDARHAPRPST